MEGVGFLNHEENREAIAQGQITLGIELGSTRIKAVLLTNDFKEVAAGSFRWENQYKDGFWTYPLELVWTGIQAAYREVVTQVEANYQVTVQNIKAIGVSAMMHGLLIFDDADHLLTPFRTWRNNKTSDAAIRLSQLFDFNIPERWSIAHLYQAVLNGEDYLGSAAFMTTLAGYVHWQLSGEKILGIGDASGMFPVDDSTGDYRDDMMHQFDSLPLVSQYRWTLRSLLPEVRRAGASGGHLTKKGAELLDPTGHLSAGSLLCPPEGDAGTGMTSTNSVRVRTGNISVGTSAFSMLVLDQPLKRRHRHLDIVATPTGKAVAMVHANNCLSDINAWMGLFSDLATVLGTQLTPDDLYAKLLGKTQDADLDAGGLLNYSYLSGENITDVAAGRPMFARTTNSHFNLANFMQTQLYAAFAPLQIGMASLTTEEHIQADTMIAQGGLFRTPVIGQQILANALNLPITIMENAGEGGPWGMALLALYAADYADQYSLEDYLAHKVFVNAKAETRQPDPAGVKGYAAFIDRYQQGLPLERQAGDLLKEPTH